MATTTNPAITDKTIRLTSANAVTYNQLVSGAVLLLGIHFIYDPLAPNWEIEEDRLSSDTFRYSLRMKRHHTGGAGESMQVLRRRATQLSRELGYTDFQVLAYSESIDSQTLGARRMAEGTVQLIHPRPDLLLPEVATPAPVAR